MGGLVLTSKATALQVVAPGSVNDSKLIQVVRYTGKLKMPPTGKLTGGEIASLEQWIEKGARWPDELESKPAVIDPSTFWAFRPVSKPTPPRIRQDSWAQTPIDQAILAGLEAKSLVPSRDEEKYTLLRRVTLDLTGLLPRMARKLDPPNPKFNQGLHLRPKLRDLRVGECPGNSTDQTGDAKIVDTAHTSGAPAFHDYAA